MQISGFTSAAMLASLSGTALSQICPNMQLTSTQGAVYAAPNGTQIPGGSRTPLEYALYNFHKNGSLANSAGHWCNFTPYLTCLPSNTPAPLIFKRGDFGAFFYGSNSTFYVCDIASNGTTNNPTWSKTNPTNNGVIYPPVQSPNDNAPWAATCNPIGLQASRCANDNEFNVSASGTGPATNGAEGITGLLNGSMLGLLSVIGVAGLMAI